MYRKLSFKPLITLFSLCCALWLTAGCTIATIRPLDPVTGKAIIGNEDQQFNAARLVAGFWDTQLMPALQESANDINTVIDALKANKDAASEEYGRRDGQQPYSFMVKGTGTVLEVNTESRAGLALMDTNGDGATDLKLAIGPVIRGTALRDSMPFIQFNQFTNQMEYASVSNEIHLLLTEKVLTPIGELTSLQGKNVTFYGAFTLGNLDEFIVTPAILTVNG